MIKIVHLITDLSLGGSEIMLLKLLTNIDHSNFKNKVISLTSIGKIGVLLRNSGITVTSLNMRQGIPDPSRLFLLKNLLVKEKPDILQTWLYHSDLLGLLAGKLAGVVEIIWNIRCSNMDMQQYSLTTSITLRLLSQISRFMKVIVVNSQAGLDYHKSIGYRPEKWIVIPNGFDTNIFYPDKAAKSSIRDELCIHKESIIIGMVARFDPAKDFLTFFRAAKQLISRRSDIHFVLVGKGINRKNGTLINHIVDLGLNKCVHLLGERYDISTVTASFDIATCSSFSEGFPNVIGEAMSCGVPCVSTDVGDAATIIGEAGRVVPPCDYQQMSNAWIDILNSSADERSVLSKSARERIVLNFSINRIVNQYEQLYYDLMQRK